MIYTCQHCGAWFPSDAIRGAVNNNETMITCKYCGHDTEFRQIKSSHISKGYDHLSVGDFYEAQREFNLAIEDSVARHKTPSPDVYFGYALSQFHVQTIFSDEDPNRLEIPQLICEKCNVMDFADSSDYCKALQALQEASDKTNFASELDKYVTCQKTIDTIKDYYNAIAKSKPKNFEYGVFIAYEDKPQDGAANRGFEFAHKVRNALPSDIKDVFLPDIDEYDNDLYYEAAILYALEHSKCMLVITDDNIDSRLTNFYSRYYIDEYNRHKVSEHGKNLGFVRYCGHITITLPDKSIAEKNVFDVDNKQDYVRFACLHNNVIVRTTKIEPEFVEAKEEVILPDDHEIHQHDVAHVPYEMLPSRQFLFGHYPQKRDASREVEAFFAEFGKPSLSNDNGWHVLFSNKKGLPYTWYRDEEFRGEKYRAVYFIKYREVYSVQESNIPVKMQKSHGYMPMRIYCFQFEPLVWDIEDMTADSVVLVANQGIDSREYNNAEMDNEWEHSTVRDWLNHDFMDTAFVDEEQSYLCGVGGNPDRVFLMDKKQDKAFYDNRHTAIMGSDYYKCIGGMGDRGINSCWITDYTNHHHDEATVICPDTHYTVSTAYVDSTLVAVLPKIILKLK